MGDMQSRTPLLTGIFAIRREDMRTGVTHMPFYKPDIGFLVRMKTGKAEN